MLRGFLTATGCAIVFALTIRATPAAEAPRGAEEKLNENRYARVHIAPTKTSIYIGTVSMTMPALTRIGGAFETTYTAKVFPYLFYNERGRLSIDFSDDMLRQLERGEPVEFKGRAVRTDGEERRLDGKVTPANASGGKIKVRVFVSKRVELIFNTTYRFEPLPTASG